MQALQKRKFNINKKIAFFMNFVEKIVHLSISTISFSLQYNI